MPNAQITATTCPRCQNRLVTDISREPWCPGCRWNLAAVEPDAPRRLGPLRRLGRRVALRLTLRTFDRLRASGKLPPRSGTRHLLAGISALLLLSTLLLGAAGVWLTVYDFPSPRIIPGVVCLAVAAVLMPRGGRLDPSWEHVDAETAPTLHALVKRVGEASGVRMPHLTVLSSDFSAGAGVFGLLRPRRVLVIGVPLWMSLTAQERVALLGHELGHFRNGDVRHSLASQLALTTFARLADVTTPSWRPGIHPSLLDRLVYLMMIPIHVSMVLMQTAILAIASREQQNAEYRADAEAARLAGKPAMAGLATKLVLGEGIVTITGAKARAREFSPEHVLPVVAEALARHAPRAADHRLRTVRTESDLFASHPPSGLRAELAEALPLSAAVIGCSTAESDRIDAELAKTYERMRKAVANGW
ncbi:MAG TPA: M48 family metallopeptidase [Phytomonospora sp.]